MNLELTTTWYIDLDKFYDYVKKEKYPTKKIKESEILDEWDDFLIEDIGEYGFNSLDDDYCDDNTLYWLWELFVKKGWYVIRDVRDDWEDEEDEE